MNSNVKSFLNYYCRLTDSHSPGYAVMVSGDWGAGKTYVVKEALEEAESPYLYVSLYGMSAVEEIGEALFQELHPVLSSPAMRVASKFAKGFLRATIKVDWDSDGKPDGSLSPQLSAVSLSRDFKNAGDRVLVFDDVERSHIPVAVVLGYINSFVEHESCKAIVIANEDEIRASEKEDYARIKEKLIGKTLKVKADFAGALGHFIGLIDDDDLRAYYEVKRDTLGDLFWKSETNNLRVLKNSLWGFERLVGHLSKEHRQHEKLMETLLRVFLVLSFEIKKGRLKEQELKHFHPESWINVKSESESIAPGPAIEKRYEGVLSGDSILAYQTWARILVDGAVDAEEIQKELNEHPLLAEEQEPSWRVLWFAHASEQEVDAAIADLEEKFLRRIYSKIGELLHVFGIRLWLARISALSPKTQKGIVEEAKAYIDDLLEQERLPPMNEDQMPDELTGWAGLGFKEQESPEFSEIRKHLEERQVEALQARHRREAPGLLDMMTSDSDLFYERLCHSNSTENLYASTPILHFLDARAFANAVLASPRSNLWRVLGTLKTRYGRSGQIATLALELPWLGEVDVILREAADSSKPVQKDILLVCIERCLHPALTEYKKLSRP